jgi:DNA modification methylase
MSDESSGYRQSRLFTDEEGEFDEERAREDALPIEDGEVIDTDELSEYQQYIEGRGIYDERNKINDLTGREWKFATKSVIHRQYPPDFQHELRGEHGGQKPPRLCLELIQRFSKAGNRVLDPFAGVGGTLFGASLAEYEGTGRRDAVGFELNPRWVALYEEVLEAENADRVSRGEQRLAKQEMRCGDCTDLIENIESESIDLLLTDVPYWSMDKVEQTRNTNKTRESKLGEFDDGEIQTKSEWLADMKAKFEQFHTTVTGGGYVILFIGDMYREQSFNMLAAELASQIQDAGYVLKSDVIWYDPSKELHVYGYPFSFVPSMVHQHILIFRKSSDSDAY